MLACYKPNVNRSYQQLLITSGSDNGCAIYFYLFQFISISYFHIQPGYRESPQSSVVDYI
jgi:hypothetical protein